MYGTCSYAVHEYFNDQLVQKKKKKKLPDNLVKLFNSKKENT